MVYQIHLLCCQWDIDFNCNNKCRLWYTFMPIRPSKGQFSHFYPYESHSQVLRSVRSLIIPAEFWSYPRWHVCEHARQRDLNNFIARILY